MAGHSEKVGDHEGGLVEPLYKQFDNILRRSIRDERLPPGVVLLEGSLARIFGSSRAPVRQALAKLEDEGLISRFDGRGYRVGADDTPIRRIELSAEMLSLDSDQEQIRKSFAWEVIYEQVERAVIQRSVFGRFRINELELARHYKVGRTVARDVLIRLESLGMVEKDERQRWSIVSLGVKRLTNLYEIREHLEPVALLHAIDFLPLEEVRTMRDRLLCELQSYPGVTAEGMDRLEHDLHIAALAHCQSKELLDALLRTRCTLTLSKHVLGVELDVPVHDPFMDEHLHVLDAIIAAKPSSAAEALRRHIRSSRPKVIERLEAFKELFSPPDVDFIS